MPVTFGPFFPDDELRCPGCRALSGDVTCFTGETPVPQVALIDPPSLWADRFDSWWW